ncbi:MAG: TAT-variant-translocated molybdopterin oxidoreductase [Gemmataceae bacterium]
MPPEFDPAREPVQPEPTYFRGIDELLETEQFQTMIKDEFPEDAPEWLDPVTRRQFVTLMGASLALAGVAGCNPSLRPAMSRKQLPYVDKPEFVTPGVPLFYTSINTLCGIGTGVVVKTLEGRPLKVEGNAHHPTSLGATDLYTQGSLLSLYDPDRSQYTLSKGSPSQWDSARTALLAAFGSHVQKQAKGQFVLLTENTSSPTLTALIEEAVTATGGKWVRYEPASPINVWEGARLAFGKVVNPVYKLDAAKVVLALDWDVNTVPVCYARQLTKARKLRVSEEAKALGQALSTDQLSRIYSVESMVTGTAAISDHRLPLKPSEIESFLRVLAEAVGVSGGPKPGKISEEAKAWATAVANDLNAKKGSAIVLAGDHLPASVHALVHAVNAKLDAVGKTVSYTESVVAKPDDQVKALKELVADMTAGKVETLVICGVNAAFTAPADVPFAESLKKVKNLFHLGQYVDETASACTTGWHINEAHYLEAWGDARGHDGTASVQQPMCMPVYGGKSAIELIATMLGKSDQSGLGLVTATWKKHFDTNIKKGDFDTWWMSALDAGVLPETALAPLTASAPSLDWIKSSPVIEEKGVEITFRPDPTIYDGRFANNGWLQECPKPITKLTWDCALIMSARTAIDEFKTDPATFSFTGGENGRMIVEWVKMTVNGKSVEAPIFVLPGHADGVITFHYGYGKTKGGPVALAGTFNEQIAIEEASRSAVNAFSVRTSDNPTWANSVKIERTGRKYILACTQGQYSMEGRRPSRHGTSEDAKKGLAAYKKSKKAFDFANDPFVAAAEKDELMLKLPGSPQELHDIESDGHHDDHDHDHENEKHLKGHDSRVVPLSMVTEKNKNPYRRWAMAIDLGACTGCSNCVAACVAENNIPVIGKTEVSRGRAMHWIRVDRYFAVPAEKGGREGVESEKRMEMLKDSAGTTVHMQPLNCQQCEKAPCELVCPVGATVHSADGLNDMAYNRCVGTRYCANNCPYKVRRFNFLQYADFATDSMKLVNNPEVTVRQRGVMEKCTYCVQRIRNAEIEAEREWDMKKVDGSAVRTRDANKRPQIRDGEILTACQQVCPAGAISFGDIADPNSEVRAWKQEPTHYGLLVEFNTMPRTGYLAAVKNPNPDIKKGA